MALKWNFVTVVMIILLNLASGNISESVVPYAINSIIEQHFANLGTSPGRVDILYFGYDKRKFSKLIDKLLKIKSEEFAIRVFEVKLKTYEWFFIRHSSIVFFESVEIFKADAAKLWWVTKERHQNQHLVYVPGLTTSDISDTYKNGFNIDHVNFLMLETDNLIELVTAYMFTPQACKQLQLKAINRFGIQTLEWENSIFYPKKYENFYGCELTVASTKINPIHSNVFNLLKTIFEEQLNAKITLKTIVEYRWNFEGCDLSTEEYSILNFYLEDLTVSDPILYHNYHFVVGSGEPYTDLERMFMMFDFELWIAISVTFGIALFTTLMLRFVSRQVRNFIVGRNVRNPTMNLLSIFLTGSQVQAPGRNFARFILMLFIVWSLIIRTCHQSMLFELMQADLRKPTIKTLDELFQSDLTLYNSNSSLVFDAYFEEQMKKSSTRLVN